jgi:hypothetical protein
MGKFAAWIYIAGIGVGASCFLEVRRANPDEVEPGEKPLGYEILRSAKMTA